MPRSQLGLNSNKLGNTTARFVGVKPHFHLSALVSAMVSAMIPAIVSIVLSASHDVPTIVPQELGQAELSGTAGDIRQRISQESSPAALRLCCTADVSQET